MPDSVGSGGSRKRTEPPPPLFLVERFWPGVKPDDVAALVARLQPGSPVSSASQTRVVHVSSLLLAEDETCLCLFEADDAEAVAEANDRAGARYDRIVAVTATPGGPLADRPG